MSKKLIIAIPRDQNDPDDFPVTEEELLQALAERKTRGEHPPIPPEPDINLFSS